VYARALRGSLHVKIAARCGLLHFGGRREEVKQIVLSPSVAVFDQTLPARMVDEISRTEELAERRRAHSADHAGLEVEEHCAWYVLAARGLVVNTLMRSSCAPLSPQYSQSPPMQCSLYSQVKATWEVSPIHKRSVAAGCHARVECAYVSSFCSPLRSSQVNTLPKAKSKTRSKQNKDMHKCSSVYSERGVPLPVLTSGGE
jgi:hypothetical protein